MSTDDILALQRTLTDIQDFLKETLKEIDAPAFERTRIDVVRRGVMLAEAGAEYALGILQSIGMDGLLAMSKQRGQNV